MNRRGSIRSGSAVKGLVLGLGLVVSASASADEFHYANNIIGERASGMGGAYTAISDDPSGLYYNPAGVVYASASNISASVNAYHHATKTYKEGLSGLSDWERESGSFVPNFFGIVQPLGKGVVGFSYAVPDSVTEDQDLDFQDPASNITRYIINFNNRDRTYKIGPSYAVAVNDRLSVGATLYFHYREREWISNQLALLNNGSYQLSNTYFQTSEYGAEPILGVMWSPRDKLAVGASVSKTVLWSSELQTQQIFRDSSTLQLSITKANNDAKRERPLRVAGGIAYFVSPALVLSADASWYESLEDPVFGNREEVLNLAFGAEYYMSPTLALRGGLFTDNANTSPISASASNQPEHLDLTGISGSVTRFTRNSSLTLGLTYTWGEGKAQIVGGSNNIQTVEAQAVTVFLATSYTY